MIFLIEYIFEKWYSKNHSLKKCFDSKNSDIVEWVSIVSMDPLPSTANGCLSRRTSKWTPPPVGWVKCNYDVSLTQYQTSGMR